MSREPSRDHSPDLSFAHRFEPATQPAAHPLLLLHGTGGDEDDLMPLGRMVAPGAALLSPRGKVLENGMPRFFRRLAEGVFDEEDVSRRAHELADFIEAARRHYGIAAPIALGYSNGANIAAAVLLLRPDALAGAVLLRAMAPLRSAPPAELAGKPVLILSGADDPIAPPANAARLATMLEGAGAAVEPRTVPAGHGLSQSDVALARGWLQTVEAAATAAPR
jgi:phospholipase/carboxylesterase